MGACCWIADPLTLIWNELLDSFKQKLGYILIDKWQDVRQLWKATTSAISHGKCFRASQPKYPFMAQVIL